jgi:general stress protein 26
MPKAAIGTRMNKPELFARCTQLIEEADTAYMATLNTDGFPQVRAMLNLRFAGQFPGLTGFMKTYAQGFETYFTTNTSSKKMQQIQANGACSVYYNVGYNGVTLIGSVSIVNDPAVKDALWQDGWELYYPQGQKDPDYAVLKFTPKKLEFFNNLTVTEAEL